jgi:hypothetical protein
MVLIFKIKVKRLAKKILFIFLPTLTRSHTDNTMNKRNKQIFLSLIFMTFLILNFFNYYIIRKL